MLLLHTADWHLGRVFHGVRLIDDQAYVLEQLILLARELKPDLVIVAGDVYDRGIPPTEAVDLLNETVSRLVLDSQIPMLIIAGNHDSPERLGFGAKLLTKQELHVCGKQTDCSNPLVFYDKHGPIYVCPFPFTETATMRQWLSLPDGTLIKPVWQALLAGYLKEIPPTARRVAAAHAYVAGGTSSESERPLNIGGSEVIDGALFQQFHYTALGHLHQAQRINPGTHYSGSLLKYSFSEANHTKSVTLVEIDHSGPTGLERIPLAPRRELRTIKGFLGDILTNPPKDVNKEDYLMVTLEDAGAILDPINKLRELFPNVLHLERPALLSQVPLRAPGGDHRKTGDLELFSSFFEQVTGAPMTARETELFNVTVAGGRDNEAD
jgi:exonuclease SbcD